MFCLLTAVCGLLLCHRIEHAGHPDRRSLAAQPHLLCSSNKPALYSWPAFLHAYLFSSPPLLSLVSTLLPAEVIDVEQMLLQ